MTATHARIESWEHQADVALRLYGSQHLCRELAQVEAMTARQALRLPISFETSFDETVAVHDTATSHVAFAAPSSPDVEQPAGEALVVHRTASSANVIQRVYAWWKGWTL